MRGLMGRRGLHELLNGDLPHYRQDHFSNQLQMLRFQRYGNSIFAQWYFLKSYLWKFCSTVPSFDSLPSLPHKPTTSLNTLSQITALSIIFMWMTHEWMHLVLHCVCWAEMSNMTETLTTEFLTVHNYILHCQASDWSVAETPHCSDVNSTPAIWESVSRPGVSNARADNPFESNLTGHWK